MSSLDYNLLYRISRVLHQQHLASDRALQSLLALVGEALQVENGSLFTFKDQDQVEHIYLLGATSTPDDAGAALWDSQLKRGLIGYVYYSRRTVVVRNINTDPRWSVKPGYPFYLKTGSAIGVPIARGATVYGTMLFVHPDVDYFNAGHIALLEEVGQIAAFALHNAQELHIARAGDTRYLTLFEHSMVPIVLTDLQGTIYDVNYQASEFLGFSRQALLGVPLHDINLIAVSEYGIEQLEEHEQTFFRMELFDMDGRELPTLVRARRLTLDGRPVLEWMLQDMSAQMELEQLRRDLTAMVYHDLRGPLGNVHASVMKLGEVLQNHHNPLVLKLLQIGLRSTQQLQRLVDGLLDIQALEERKVVLNTQPTEIRPLLLDVVQLVQALAQEADQVIEVEFDDNLPTAWLDEDMITRVLINLVENAIKYTPEGGLIRLQARMRGHYILIIVSDSGPGIPEAMRRRIFDKFSRVKYQDVPKGVGLGLAFCRLAVQAHRGHIWVDSDGKSGSDFKFTLQRATSQEVQTDTAESPDEPVISSAASSA